MSWNTSSWNFLPNNNQSTGYGQDEINGRPATSQWYNTQQTTDDRFNSNEPSHSYRAWKQENGVKAYGDRQTQHVMQQPRLPFNRGLPDQPQSTAHSSYFNSNGSSGNFNFNNSNSYQQSAYTQPPQHQIPSSDRDRAFVFSSNKQPPNLNPDYSQHPHFTSSVSGRQAAEMDHCRMNTVSTNHNRTQDFSSSMQPGALDGQIPQNCTSDFAGCRHPTYSTRSHSAVTESAGRNSNSVSGHRFSSMQKENKARNGREFPGKLSKTLKSSLRVVTCSTEAVHMWRHTLGDDVSLMFELFGTLARLDYDGDNMSFELKGKSLHIRCVFFPMDMEPAAISDGAIIRVIGRMEGDLFQCVSIRLATADERSHAWKLVQMYNTSLHRFNVRNEQ